MAIPAPRPGSVALVTGASSGIGRELARQLAERGHDLVLIARRRQRLSELAAEIFARHGRRVEVLDCDLADPDARERLLSKVEALGVAVDVAALSAGFGFNGPFVDNDRDRITEMVRLNVESVFALTHAVVTQMAPRRTGAVLLVASMAGKQPMPNFAAYSATKAAVLSLAEALSEELGDAGITVTALAPGDVTTEFAAVAGMTGLQASLPSAMTISPEACVRQGLEGLAAGQRVVVPKLAVRALTALAKYLPRGLWLRICRRML